LTSKEGFVSEDKSKEVRLAELFARIFITPQRLSDFCRRYGFSPDLPAGNTPLDKLAAGAVETCRKCGLLDNYRFFAFLIVTAPDSLAEEIATVSRLWGHYDL